MMIPDARSIRADRTAKGGRACQTCIFGLKNGPRGAFNDEAAEWTRRPIRYSCRRAIAWLTLVARRAGTKDEAAIAAASNNGTPMNVTGS